MINFYKETRKWPLGEQRRWTQDELTACHEELNSLTAAKAIPPDFGVAIAYAFGSLRFDLVDVNRQLASLQGDVKRVIASKDATIADLRAQLAAHETPKERT